MIARQLGPALAGLISCLVSGGAWVEADKCHLRGRHKKSSTAPKDPAEDFFHSFPIGRVVFLSRQIAQIQQLANPNLAHTLTLSFPLLRCHTSCHRHLHRDARRVEFYDSHNLGIAESLAAA